jgi:hypothetical protein
MSKTAIGPMVDFIDANEPEDVALAITEFIMSISADLYRAGLTSDWIMLILQKNSFKHFGVTPDIQFHQRQSTPRLK